MAPPGTYVILFDFDRSDLNDAGQAVINQILADIQASRRQRGRERHGPRRPVRLG